MSIISLIPKSPRVPFATLQLIARACTYQFLHDVSPAWQKTPWSVVAAPDVAHAPHGSFAFEIIEEDQQNPDAAAWHSETENGVIVLQAMVSAILDNGGTLTKGANSVSAAISHECVETFVDPNVASWFQGPDGRLYAGEACDPCQDLFYDVLGVAVSDFVKPAYFDPYSQAAAKDLSKLGFIPKPFGRSTTGGGYQAIMVPAIDDSGNPVLTVTNEFGAMVEEWKKEWKTKHGARLSHRRSTPSVSAVIV